MPSKLSVSTFLQHRDDETLPVRELDGEADVDVGPRDDALPRISPLIHG